MALIVPPTFMVGQAGITSAAMNNIPNAITGLYNGRPLLAVHDGGSGTTSIPNQTWVQVALGTVDLDTHSGWASNQYTAPLSGYYMIMGCVVFSSTTASGHSAAVRLVINTHPVAGIGSHLYPSDGSSVPGVAISRMVYLAKNDQIHLEAFQDTGATVSSNNSGVASERPFFDAIYIGA